MGNTYFLKFLLSEDLLEIHSLYLFMCLFIFIYLFFFQRDFTGASHLLTIFYYYFIWPANKNGFDTTALESTLTPSNTPQSSVIVFLCGNPALVNLNTRKMIQKS